MFKIYLHIYFTLCGFTRYCCRQNYIKRIEFSGITGLYVTDIAAGFAIAAIDALGNFVSDALALVLQTWRYSIVTMPIRCVDCFHLLGLYGESRYWIDFDDIKCFWVWFWSMQMTVRSILGIRWGRRYKQSKREKLHVHIGNQMSIGNYC